MSFIKANLNPCPLCGGVARVFSIWWLNDGFRAECMYCGVRSPSHPELTKAIDNWNSRSKSKYTRTEKKRQKQVSARQNLGYCLWDYNSKGKIQLKRYTGSD